MDNQDVLIQRDGTIATVKLNRVGRHNSLVPSFLQALVDAFSTLGADDSVSVIKLTSAAKSFSTGGDLLAFYEHRENPEPYAQEIVGLLNQTIIAMIECPKPIVAVVNGQVTGGSMGLVLGSDIVLVSERASFTPYYVEVGFSPDGGWSTLLNDVIGYQRAKVIQLLNKAISADDALSWGLAFEKIYSAEIDAASAALCESLSSKKGKTLASTKRMARYPDYQQRLDAELQAFCQLVVTEDAQQGLKDFLDGLKQ
ncbi:MAG: enoyl-CoA hydratase/isomerase family protein [Cellvibrionaceae bacterium]